MFTDQQAREIATVVAATDDALRTAADAMAVALQNTVVSLEDAAKCFARVTLPQTGRGR